MEPYAEEKDALLAKAVVRDTIGPSRITQSICQEFFGVIDVQFTILTKMVAILILG